MNKVFVFAGNRFFVLEEMLKAGLDIAKIFAVQGSYLENELNKRGISFEHINSGKELTAQLEQLTFTHFVANGLPYILPITRLTNGSQKVFVNIHPSYLPDLRGKDPIPAAVLYGRDSGATCHYMNDKIDDGDIIAQVKIDYTADLDCALLYQLSFLAEKQAFNKALQNDFAPTQKQELNPECISYKLNPQDRILDFQNDVLNLIRQVKAFNTKSQGAYFVYQEQVFIVKSARKIDHNFSILSLTDYDENQIVFVFENKVLLRKDNGFLYLEEITGNISLLKPGVIL